MIRAYISRVSSPHHNKIRMTWKICPFIGILILILLIMVYCFYITGKVVDIGTVNKFIQCSLFSIGLDGYFHKVTIRIDKSILKIKNKNLKGILQISILTPYGEYVWNYWISRPRTICIDISKTIQDFEKYYEKIRHLQDTVELTIWFTLYMYDDNGHMYIASYGYDTFSLIMLTSKSYLEAADTAYKDPLRAFRYPLLIVISKKDINYVNITGILKETLNRILLELYNSNLTDIIRKHKIARSYVSKCRDIFMIKIWNLTGRLEKLSYIYLYPVDRYSVYDALRCTILETGFTEGINIIKNLHTIREILKKVPIGIIFKCRKRYPIEALIELTEPPYARYISGISFLGYIISGYYNIHSNLWLTKIYYSSCDSPNLFILVPVLTRNVAKGVVVIYYVQKLKLRGREYWIVIPISATLPIYFIRLNMSSIETTGKLHISNTTFTEYKLIFEKTLRNYTESSYKIFSECSACMPSNFSYFAYLVSPLTYYTKKSHISIEDAFSSLFYMTYFNSGPTSIAFILSITTYNLVKARLNVEIYALSGKYQPYYLVNNSKYFPLVSNYVISVR